MRRTLPPPPPRRPGTGPFPLVPIRHFEGVVVFSNDAPMNQLIDRVRILEERAIEMDRDLQRLKALDESAERQRTTWHARAGNWLALIGVVVAIGATVVAIVGLRIAMAK